MANSLYFLKKLKTKAMKKLSIYLSVTLVFLLIHSSCLSHRPNRMPDFKIKKAYYQSWHARHHARGTDVVIVIKKIKPGIRFKSIVYRGMEAPVQQRIYRNKIILTARFSAGNSPIARQTRYRNQPDQLIYTHGRHKERVYLNNLQRKRNKYYRRY